ncbi:hypothetical protein ABT360_32335, partial [Streptomyces sp. NPDC000229]
LLSREDLGLRLIAGPDEADVHWVHTSEMGDPPAPPRVWGAAPHRSRAAHPTCPTGADSARVPPTPPALPGPTPRACRPPHLPYRG